MWVLCENAKSPEVVHYLLCNRDILVGRRTDVKLEDDKSVSRTHARLHITYQQDDVCSPAAVGQVTLCDTSKYGTFVDGQKMDGDRVVGDGAVITFGLQWNTWTLRWRPLTVVSSLLPRLDRDQLSGLLAELGATLQPGWTPDVGLLVMATFKMSVKAVQALAAGVPIVTPAYIRATCECRRVSTTSPTVSADDFRPPFDEPTLNGSDHHIGVDTRRQTLFVGKQFVFVEESQLKRLKVAIELAGGTPMLFFQCDMSPAELTSPNVVVMHTDVKSPQINKLRAVLKRKKLRMVQDQEVGLAVLRVSTERDCNPAFDYTASFLTPLASTQSQAVRGAVLAKETQPPEPPVRPLGRSQTCCVVPPTPSTPASTPSAAAPTPSAPASTRSAAASTRSTPASTRSAAASTRSTPASTRSAAASTRSAAAPTASAAASTRSAPASTRSAAAPTASAAASTRSTAAPTASAPAPTPFVSAPTPSVPATAPSVRPTGGPDGEVAGRRPRRPERPSGAGSDAAPASPAAEAVRRRPAVEPQPGPDAKRPRWKRAHAAGPVVDRRVTWETEGPMLDPSGSRRARESDGEDTQSAFKRPRTVDSARPRRPAGADDLFDFDLESTIQPAPKTKFRSESVGADTPSAPLPPRPRPPPPPPPPAVRQSRMKEEPDGDWMSSTRAPPPRPSPSPEKPGPVKWEQVSGLGGGDEAELAGVCVRLEKASLICRRQTPAPATSDAAAAAAAVTGPNFKRFRRVRQPPPCPHIIGGSDFFVSTRRRSVFANAAAATNGDDARLRNQSRRQGQEEEDLLRMLDGVGSSGRTGRSR